MLGTFICQDIDKIIDQILGTNIPLLQVQRRILSAGGRRLVNLEQRMDGGVDFDESLESLRIARSPEVGSAVSAREHHLLGTSDSSSVNGNRH